MVKGDFKITSAYLKEIGASQDNLEEFQNMFPDGAGYQDVLDRCAEEGHVDFGAWLLEKLGPTNDERIYEERVNTPEKNTIFAGRLKFKKGEIFIADRNLLKNISYEDVRAATAFPERTGEAMNIELNLSSETKLALKLKAAEGGMSVSELVDAFVNDLVHGERTNGSDERMYANDWYDRCGFAYGSSTSFFQWLARNGELEDALGQWSELKSMEEDLAEEKDPAEVAWLTDEITWHENVIQRYYREYGGTGDWKQEMADVAEKWEETAKPPEEITELSLPFSQEPELGEEELEPEI